MLPLRSRRCGAPTQSGAPCQRREVFTNGLCQAHGGTGELARIARKQAKDSRRRDSLVKEAMSFVAQMRAAGHLPPKAGQ
jgi:hypothetical protein